MSRSRLGPGTAAPSAAMTAIKKWALRPGKSETAAHHPTSSFARVIMGVGFGEIARIRRSPQSRPFSADFGRSAAVGPRQGDQPCPLCNVPSGGDRGVTADVRRHLVDDRSTAGLLRPGMSIPSIKYGNASVEGRHTSVRAEQRGSALRHGQSHAHSPLARGERAVPLPRLVKSASPA